MSQDLESSATRVVDSSWSLDESVFKAKRELCGFPFLARSQEFDDHCETAEHRGSADVTACRIAESALRLRSVGGRV